VTTPTAKSQLMLATACRPLRIDDNILVLLLLVFGSPTRMTTEHPPL